MKSNRTIPLVFSLGTAVLVAGCDRQQQTANQPLNEPPQAISAEAKPAKAKDFIAQTKDDFVAASDQKLQDLERKIDELAQNSESFKGDAKAQAETALAELRDQRDKAKAKLADLKTRGSEAWDEMKAGFTVAMNDLEKAYENARSKFN